ncbi:MAG: serine aminopeptidase domain-containing protein [Phycisphaerae bacterium]
MTNPQKPSPTKGYARRRATANQLCVGVLLLTVALSCGCFEDSSIYLTEQRKANGLVVILPGIEGESSMNRDIRKGLDRAGIQAAMPIYHWGRPIPIAGMVLNQMDVVGNRMAGERIARMVREYQQSYPGRPVYLVGHSGGGGVAVFAAEAMPDDTQLDGLILLSASISAGYDLTKALSHCRQGIVNFYNPRDVGLLAVGTTLTSTVDGVRGPSAGLEGFQSPGPATSTERRYAYRKLYQFELRASMSRGDPHAAATRPGFVSSYVAPWVRSEHWPAGSGYAAGEAETPLLTQTDLEPLAGLISPSAR